MRENENYLKAHEFIIDGSKQIVILSSALIAGRNIWDSFQPNSHDSFYWFALFSFLSVISGIAMNISYGLSYALLLKESITETITGLKMLWIPTIFLFLQLIAFFVSIFYLFF